MLHKTILLVLVLLVFASPAQARHHPRATQVMSGFVGGSWICPELPSGHIVVQADVCATALPSWF